MTIREAEALRDLWGDYLRRDERSPLMPPADTKAEIRLGKLLRTDPIPVVPAAPEHIWVWSDLHLSDPGAEVSRRPFRTTDEMDDHLISAWHTRVGDDDWIICLGDVAHGRALESNDMLRRLRRCPGRRLLVLGNHDLEARPGLEEAGLRGPVCRGALCDRAARRADPHPAPHRAPDDDQRARPPARQASPNAPAPERQRRADRVRAGATGSAAGTVPEPTQPPIDGVRVDPEASGDSGRPISRGPERHRRTSDSPVRRRQAGRPETHLERAARRRANCFVARPPVP